MTTVDGIVEEKKNNIVKLFIDKEPVYIKKSFGYYNVVYPIKSDDGRINWFNLITGGDLFKFFFLVLMVILLLLTMNEYSSNMSYCQSVINNVTTYIR